LLPPSHGQGRPVLHEEREEDQAMSKYNENVALVIPGCLEADASTGRKHFFLKKEAKTLGHLAYAPGQR
jgi:hypothetical protein